MSCGTTHTGVKATEEETRHCRQLATEAGRTPVILVGDVDMSGAAWKRANEAVYAAALAHGLPEIEGYYGMTPEGEFVTA